MKKCKKITIFLGIISFLFIHLLLSMHNDISSWEYTMRKDPQFVSQELNLRFSDSRNSIYIYRSQEAVHLVLLKRRSVLGILTWKMIEIDRLNIADGPSWSYVEVKTNDLSTIPIVYGFLYHDPYKPTSLHLVNTADDIDQSVISTRLTKLRSWYTILSSPSQAPGEFILLEIKPEEPSINDKKLEDPPLIKR